MTDSFMRFWFRYEYPYQGELKLGHVQLVLDEMHKDFVSKFVAYVYEDICREIFAQLCLAEELDLVAIDKSAQKTICGRM